MKLCTKCVHCDEHEIFGIGERYCMLSGGISPVDGSRVGMLRCHNMRSMYQRCGPQGNLFEEKIGITQRVFRIVKSWRKT